MNIEEAYKNIEDQNKQHCNKVFSLNFPGIHRYYHLICKVFPFILI